MSEKKGIKISAAKGRPMLTWVGKRPLRSVTAFPAQHVETFAAADVEASHESPTWKDWPSVYPHGGLLFNGDNKEVLGHLLANGFRGKVNLIYIDPPFDSGADYVRNVKLRGVCGKVKIEGENYSLGEQIQYSDIWANDNYLQFMYERLQMLKELLADGGSFFIHCDSTKSHLLRCILDEIFGHESFVNEIIWSYRRWPSTGNKFQSMHDTIFFYEKKLNNDRVFHKFYEDPSESYLKRFGGKTQILDEETGTRKITSEEDTKGMPQRDVWDISIIAGFKGERENYPTQKPEDLIARILSTCTNPNDLVLDCFIGSGTTAAVAQKLGRRWIGCDINKGAIQTTAKRLQGIMTEQAEAIHESPQQLPGMETDEAATPAPAQLSFGVWRVNDYDLKIQRNEAIKLACEHVGVERLGSSEGFFDGKLGKKLVKIAPFEHPLSPLDLEELKRELEARPELENTIVFVCLGIELTARTWVEDWNRLRKGTETVNKIEVIELRTDAKYGNFIKHEPATAKVTIARSGDKVIVKIEDFISPTILKRLDMDLPLFKAKITDWRSQVDCVMIDTAYDGTVFNVTLSDVPEKKNDLIDGAYALPAPTGKTTVAVKIIDMLGEEVFITENICD